MRRNKRIFVLAVLLFSFLCFPTDRVLAKSKTAEVPLTMKQSFELKNVEKEIDLTGTYELRALDVDAPMPENAEDTLYSFALEGEQAHKTISLQYLHGGVYRYQLVQTTKDKDFYQYDRSCYNITVYVKNGENGELIPQVIAEKNDRKKYEELQFINSYKGRGSESSKPSGPSEQIKTGDQTGATVYLAVAMSAFSVIILLVCLKRKTMGKNRV